MPAQQLIRILVASPNSAERLGLATIIASQPYMEVVAQASSSEDTSQVLRAGLSDVVLVDALLLNDSVIKAMEACRNHDRKPALIVIAAHEMDAATEQALKVGAKAVLLKGVPYTALIRTVRRVFNASRRHIGVREPDHYGVSNA